MKSSVANHSTRQTTNRPSRGGSARTPAENAARMLSETAHDIRAPLATIRETVSLVNEGLVGEINDEQQELLSAAINQCECINQMVEEMIQFERLHSGVPRITRGWISVSAVCQLIDTTLQPWAGPRGINLYWDNSAGHNARVFGDASMLRRLVVNLAVNAIRATPEGGSVLISVQPVAGSEALRWSVVDQGRGISEEDMQQITQRQVSKSGGEGLGLSICRQLSALHFSDLMIESRFGTGTAVSFQTVGGGPRSVAEDWANWRVSQRAPLQRPVNRDYQDDVGVEIDPASLQVRFDVPAMMVRLRAENTAPNVEDRASLGTVTLSDSTPNEACERFDHLFQLQMGMYDFVYRIGQRQWVWVFDSIVSESESRIDAINESVLGVIADLGISWSEPQSMPLDDRRTAMRLADVFVRQSLSANNLPDLEIDAAEMDGAVAQDESLEIRLERELKQVTERLAKQNSMQAQSRRLRPNF